MPENSTNHVSVKDLVGSLIKLELLSNRPAPETEEAKAVAIQVRKDIANLLTGIANLKAATHIAAEMKHLGTLVTQSAELQEITDNNGAINGDAAREQIADARRTWNAFLQLIRTRLVKLTPDFTLPGKERRTPAPQIPQKKTMGNAADVPLQQASQKTTEKPTFIIEHSEDAIRRELDEPGLVGNMSLRPSESTIRTIYELTLQKFYLRSRADYAVLAVLLESETAGLTRQEICTLTGYNFGTVDAALKRFAAMDGGKVECRDDKWRISRVAV